MLWINYNHCVVVESSSYNQPILIKLGNKLLWWFLLQIQIYIDVNFRDVFNLIH